MRMSSAFVLLSSFQLLISTLGSQNAQIEAQKSDPFLSIQQKDLHSTGRKESGNTEENETEFYFSEEKPANLNNQEQSQHHFFSRNLQSNNIIVRTDGSEVHEWNEATDINLSRSYDKSDRSATLDFAWSCPLGYSVQCPSLQEELLINQLDRILEYQMFFGIPYEFSVGITSPSSAGGKLQELELQIKSPENSFEDPSACLQFEFEIVDRLGRAVENWRESNLNERNFDQKISFDTFNVTDQIYFQKPKANYESCSYAPKIESGEYALLFSTYTRDELLFDASFGEVHNWYFETGPDQFVNKRLFFGNEEQFKKALATVEEHKQKFYLLIVDKAAKSFVDFQSLTIATKLNGDSIFASLRNKYIEIDYDEDLLVLDASGSFDARGDVTKLKYTWRNNVNNVVFYDKQKLVLTPFQRGRAGLNSAGTEYIYTLFISDETRISEAANVAVKIKPEVHPSGCVTVGIADINIFSKTITLNPIDDQIKVFAEINSRCSGLIFQDKLWESIDLNWQHWESFPDDDSLIQINNVDIDTLPKMQNIPMRVTVFYIRFNIEYKAYYDFNLFINQEDLEPVLTFVPIQNLAWSSTVSFDASRSYDPTQPTATSSEGISCDWKCPQEYVTGGICTAEGFKDQCKIQIASSAVLRAPNYGNSITTKALPFELTLTKGEKVEKRTVFFTALTDETFPLCFITQQREIKMNQFGLFKAECSSIDETDNPKIQFEWKMFLADGTELEIPESGTSPGRNDRQFFRTNSLWFSGLDAVDLQLYTIYDTAYYSTVRTRLYFNNASKITEGTFRQRQSKVYAYNNQIRIVPSSDWESRGGKNLKFQVRAKTVQEDSYILMAPRYLTGEEIRLQIPYTSNIFIDALDAEGNYVTQDISKRLNVKRPKEIKYETFYESVTTHVREFKYNLSEEEFEDEIYDLKMKFEALYYNIVNPPLDLDNFYSLCDETLDYLYLQMITDDKISKVQDLNRKLKIKSDVIEILWVITSLDYTINNPDKVLGLIRQFLKPDLYYISENIFISTRKLAFVLHNMQHYTEMSFWLDDLVINLMRSCSNEFLVPGESLHVTQSETQELQITRLNEEMTFQDLKMGTNITVKASALQSQYVSGQLNSVFMMRNKTQAQVFYLREDSLIFNNLPEKIEVEFNTSPFFTERILFNKNRAECDSRWLATNNWGRIEKELPTDNRGYTFGVNCLGNTFGLFLLTYSGEEAEEQIDLFAQQKGYDYGLYVPTVYLLSDGLEDYIYRSYKSEFWSGLVVLIVFVYVCNQIAYWVSRGEKNDRLSDFLEDQEPVYSARFFSCCSSGQKSLFWTLLKNFNPILNLFCVQNKFLERWLRSMMLQSYFMFFYVAFCFSMWTSDQNSEEETFGHVLWERISLGAGLIVLTIFVRPVLLNLIYFVFYEPLSKVEEGDIKTLKRLRLAVKKRKIETKTFTKTATQDLTRNAEESGKFENERVSKDTTAVVGATALNFKKATPDRLAQNDESQAKLPMIGDSLPSARRGVKFEDMPDNLVSNEESKEQLSSLAQAEKEVSNLGKKEEKKYGKKEGKKMATISEFSDRNSKVNRATVDPEQLFEGGETEQGSDDLEGKNPPQVLEGRRGIKSSGKKLFVSRILGSVAFLILWGLLLLLSLVLTYNSTYQTFGFCVELTFLCMVAIQLVVDPILYTIAMKFMVRRHRALHGSKEALSTSSLVYFTLQSDRKYGGYLFFQIFIGQRKMEDLERSLCIVQNAKQMRRAND